MRPETYRELLALAVQVHRVAPWNLAGSRLLRRQHGERQQPGVDVLDQQRVVSKRVGGRLHPIPAVWVRCRDHLRPEGIPKGGVQQGGGGVWEGGEGGGVAFRGGGVLNCCLIEGGAKLLPCMIFVGDS